MARKKHKVLESETKHEHGAGCHHHHGLIEDDRSSGASARAGKSSAPSKNIDISDKNPGHCKAVFNGCSAHGAGKSCGPGCGHEEVSHGGHKGYLVPDGKGGYDLHCPHDGHCDNHGKIKKPSPKP